MFDQSDAHIYLASIVTSSDDAIISKDLNGNITSWNISAERIFGFTTEEAVGKHISIIIPPDYLKDEDFILGRIRAGLRVEHFEAVRRHKNGRRIDLSVTISPIKDASGKIIGASKVARDVTDMKAGERAQAYLGAIVDSSDDAVIGKDLSGCVTSWNVSAARIFGYTAEEMIGRSITTLIPTELLAEEEKILTALKNGQRLEHVETVRRHKSGRSVYVSITVSPIRDGNGRIIGASKVARDISDRIKIEEALRELSRKKDDFISTISHELRTPMNAVIGLTGLLQLSKNLGEKERKYVDTLKISADSLMELINDLLDFAKLEANSVELEKAEFSLAEQVQNALSIIEVKAAEKQLALHVAIEVAPDRYFIGDPMRLRQILMNLLSNAVKFTKRGTIEVSVTEEPDAGANISSISIRVKDSGVGIPYDKQTAIFEKFTQGDASINRRFGGSGLGLAISKSLAELMDGRIYLESEPGVGSIFTLQIPFTRSEKRANEQIVATVARPVVHKDILLVEDYAPSIMVTGALLEQFGYDYDVARNGFEALRKFRDGKYDIILMDVQMQELDGIETTRRIRKIEYENGAKPVKIIAMTAHVREKDKAHCLAAGMDDFVAKPFEPTALSKVIALHTGSAS